MYKKYPFRVAHGVQIDEDRIISVSATPEYWSITSNISSEPIKEIYHAAGGHDELVIRQLHSYINYDQTTAIPLLRFSGFIIDDLYISDKKGVLLAPSIHSHPIAARLCRGIIAFWQHELQQGQEKLDDLRIMRAEAALPMLWRSYVYALAATKILLQPFLDNQKSLPDDFFDWGSNLDPDGEYTRALRTWQRICLDTEHAWFFTDYLCSWLDRPESDWQAVREEEVQRIVWQDSKSQTLRAPGTDSPAARRRLEFLVKEWYLPRYDLKMASQIKRILIKEQYRNSRWRARIYLLVHWLFVGTERLIGGIAIGFVATALGSDTWQKVLLPLISNEYKYGFIIGILLAIGTYVFLANGIQRHTGLSLVWTGNRKQFPSVHRRIFGVWLRGQFWALCFASITSILIGRLFLGPTGTLLGTLFGWICIILLYAQIALIVGIVTQLLFDDKPTTAPLEGP